MSDLSRGAARESDVRRIYFDLSTGAVRLIDSDHVYRWRLHEYSLRALRDAPSANLAGSRAGALYLPTEKIPRSTIRVPAGVVCPVLRCPVAHSILHLTTTIINTYQAHQ